MIIIEVKKIEEGLVPIYENETKERLINARELHKALMCNRQYANWIREKINKYYFLKNQDFFTFNKFVKREGSNLGTRLTEYYITIDMAKELCMVENNETGRKIRRYFIETEKRYVFGDRPIFRRILGLSLNSTQIFAIDRKKCIC